MLAEKGIIFDIMAGRIASRKPGKIKLRYRVVSHVMSQKERREELKNEK